MDQAVMDQPHRPIHAQGFRELRLEGVSREQIVLRVKWESGEVC